MGKQKEKAKSLQQLNLSDNFLLGEVMSDPVTCGIALKIILEKDVYGVESIVKEQQLDVNPKYKGIRLDVAFKDAENQVYNMEMQTVNRYNLPRRSRHYQGMIDIKLLLAGEIDYNKMPDGTVIFICTFDPFDRKRYRYTFENRCVEEPDLTLEDGSRKIFLNTKGRKIDQTSPELIDFLRYVEHTTTYKPVTEPVQKIAERVEQVKADAEVEVRYMTLEMYKNELITDGKIQGQNRMLLLVQKMMAAGEGAFIVRLSEPEFLEEMYQKYQL